MFLPKVVIVVGSQLLVGRRSRVANHRETYSNICVGQTQTFKRQPFLAPLTDSIAMRLDMCIFLKRLFQCIWIIIIHDAVAAIAPTISATRLTVFVVFSAWVCVCVFGNWQNENLNKKKYRNIKRSVTTISPNVANSTHSRSSVERYIIHLHIEADRTSACDYNFPILFSFLEWHDFILIVILLWPIGRMTMKSAGENVGKYTAHSSQIPTFAPLLAAFAVAVAAAADWIC